MRCWQDLQSAQRAFSQGKLVAIPTETVYGLAAPIFNEKLIHRIFEVKERPFFDPLIVHIGRFKEIDELAENFNSLEWALAKRFWPGPLTLITRKKKIVSDLITSGLEKLGIRMPAHPLARRLIRTIGAPLAAPSANKFGRTSPTTAEHVRSEFSETDVYLLDGGPSEIGIESTVCEARLENSKAVIKILRPGKITEQDFKDFFEMNLSFSSFEIIHSASAAAPGQLENHYQAKIPLVITADHPTQTQIEFIQTRLKLTPATISTNAHFAELRLSDQASIAARQLYSSMRELSESGNNWMYVRRSIQRSDELWASIWNRLQRASSLEI